MGSPTRFANARMSALESESASRSPAAVHAEDSTRLLRRDVVASAVQEEEEEEEEEDGGGCALDETVHVG